MMLGFRVLVLGDWWLYFWATIENNKLLFLTLDESDDISDESSFLFLRPIQLSKNAPIHGEFFA